MIASRESETYAHVARATRVSRSVDKRLARVNLVDLIEHCGNRRREAERLFVAWNRGSGEGAVADGEPDDPLIAASAEPTRRPRTRLTDEEVDAMRTARANGVSMTVLASQYGIHRGTVWAKTRNTKGAASAAVPQTRSGN